MNELQKIEYGILQDTIRICDLLKLKYFLLCGTALGAVKYQGFIPWDDDIDIGLFREDYKKFLAEAPTLLKDYYFLQTYQTDKYYPNIFAKIRDNRTTFVEVSSKNIEMNHGVYIDIFPLDGYPMSQVLQKKLEIQKRVLNCFIFSPFEVKRSFFGRCGTYLIRFIGLHKKTGFFAKKLENAVSQYDIVSGNYICNHGNWQGRLDYSPKEHFGDGCWATFEGLMVRIPEKYDEYLTQKYGNWRAELPEEQKVGHHYADMIDLHTSYYITMLKRNK